MTEIEIIASPHSWIEGAAIEQLKTMAKLPGMRLAVGLPDLHPGKGHPIGAAFLSEGQVYPFLVGNDIGCGMGLWQTDLQVRKFKAEKNLRKLEGLETPWEGDTQAWLQDFGLEPTPYDTSLGTIGGGNHFAELQKITRIADPDALAELEIDPNCLLLLVHSGSRGLGESILRAHTERFGAQGLAAPSPEAEAYLQAHDLAVRWSEANRTLIQKRFLNLLGAQGKQVLDRCHNSVCKLNHASNLSWLHRKGASPADQGAVVIPGSRGSSSYLVKALPSEKSAWSLAHGAGRKWSRGETKGRLEKRFKPENLQRTEKGSWVICENRELLYEEAPQAYKAIDRVVQDLVDAGLAEIIAEMDPVITYKTRRS
ncbi:RNA ligase RtcB family protein [bacterium (Candidatus Blackallbacteria) CG17_big_fil_post_rev_8_21_14_2_50_48_46]|uniref:3'-phosphate/5'-hydroxy nucleic acid ligase n=1 Tax=bacterium (Candidatus Blackallbacteria) CG17_big_fil_post_rev_8_21_14_2_50_48_46 TaxID=2014261 RepID=A0A2M7G5V8_9BACT|nr:MAG: RNA ligase RtcB family protein [bacterium (Candidatus Blackallbacteria) CG18_big_fil_WC_8_21_14_2_50_49_26]PIW17348.1 MAG: RNA ligase RtcB family protein [bacterium (Candidatus Blackallbacteria) CG17_big_fil_post_rev_8_21_14_2_50_48_46]PIW47420.1 MAG: RNA ligase RtcB family protein [bacterium (Candidatus Blackallbacteria) CG13_big_fil_rev_8_21_14_2_50_49_14]